MRVFCSREWSLPKAERTRGALESIAVVSEVHEEPGGTGAEETDEHEFVVDKTMVTIPKRDGVGLGVVVACLLEFSRFISFVTDRFEEPRRLFEMTADQDGQGRNGAKGDENAPIMSVKYGLRAWRRRAAGRR